MMVPVDRHTIVLLSVFFLLTACFNNSNDQTAKYIKSPSKDSFYTLYNDVICKKISDDIVFNDLEILHCSQLNLVDEPCLLFTNLANTRTLARLQIVDRKASSSIVTIESKDKCWLKTIKVIPEGRYGQIVYLLQNKDIQYSVRKELVAEDDFLKIVDLNQYFTDIQVHENASEIYIIELIQNKEYSKKYSSDLILPENLIYFIKEFANY